MTKKQPINLQLLQNLVSYNSELAFPAKKNLELLSDKKTLVVATGQQVGLYISPVLAIYKALAAIKLAANYEKKLKVPVVPIFWLQTEDHDYDEVRNSSFLNAQGLLNSVSLSAKDGKIPISERKLQSEIEKVNNETSEIIAGLPNDKQAIEFLYSSYLTNNDLGLSFAKLMSYLLGDRGLIFLDPVKSEVSKYANKIYKASLKNFSQIAAILRESTTTNQQVALRDNATLFFYRHNNDRERLIKNDDGSFSVNNEVRLTQSELEQKMDTEPLRFSASALLRPIIQDSILPTIAYLGGSAEIQYLEQSKAIYPIFEVSQASAIKRPSFTIIDQKSKHWLDQLKITSQELAIDNIDKLLAAKLLPSNIQPEFLSNSSTEKINAIFDQLDSAVISVDSTLSNSAKKARERSLESVKILIEKYTKAASLKDQVWSDRIKKISTLTFPNSKPQERILSALYFYARFGDEFITKVYDSINPEQISSEIELII